MKKTILASLLAFAAFGAVAHAEEKAACGDIPQARWMSQDALKAKIAATGLQVRQIKVEAGCYEVYGIDAKGAKVEALFNPETGEQVGTDGGN